MRNTGDFMNSFNKEIGKLGEEISERHLKGLGYIILDRNFTCKIGEIDIICKDGDHIVFVEVKTRYDKRYGSPSEAVTHYKQNKICKTAQFYIMVKKLHKLNFRFDVIEVFLNRSDNEYTLRLIKNAFQT